MDHRRTDLGLASLGFAPDPLTGQIPAPHPATVRRLLERPDGDALDRAIGAFLDNRLARTAATAEPDIRTIRRAIAVDGKTVRGSRTTEPTAPISGPVAPTTWRS